MLKKMILAIALLGSFSCAKENGNSNVNVLNGIKPSDGSYPLKTTIGIVDHRGFIYCTGIYIGKRHILTAAHCVDPIAYPKICKGHLFWGKHGGHRDNYSINFNGAKIIYHDKFIRRAEIPNDIALIVLEKEPPRQVRRGMLWWSKMVDLTEPAIIASKETVSDNDLLTHKDTPKLIAGYGKSTIFPFTNDSGELLFDKVSENEKYELTLSPDKKIIKSKNALQGFNSGDSGGTFWIEKNGKNIVVGVHIKGANFGGSQTTLNTHTDLRYYRDWIESNGGINLKTLKEKPAKYVDSKVVDCSTP